VVCFAVIVGWLWRVRHRPLSSVDVHAAAVDQHITRLGKLAKQEELAAQERAEPGERRTTPPEIA
jgi:hypothetical protein